ncbi:hypothetical protein [Pleomorphomonas sp. T1.2MG-36]|uniref:hypothetical protein n=1 Tax=Pleomorphomonas sp. T1.2MG-36 TaxID=3041167 RepID=UPI002541BC43|nr:hypothetical protein [Pleomorphomonas sp. T1.2MG-36]
MENAGGADRLGHPLRRHIAIVEAEGQQRGDCRLQRVGQIRRIGKLGQRGVERRQTTLTAERFRHSLLDQCGLRENGDGGLGSRRRLKVEQGTGRRLLSKRLARLTGVRLDFVGHRRQRADRHGHAPGEIHPEGCVETARLASRYIGSVAAMDWVAASRPPRHFRSALVDQLRLAGGQRLIDASARRKARRRLESGGIA